MKRAYYPQKTFAPVVTVLIGALCKGEIKCRLLKSFLKDMVLYFAFTGAAHRNILKLRGQKD